VAFGSKSIDEKKINVPQINAKAMTFNDGLFTFSQEIPEHAETAKRRVHSRKSKIADGKGTNLFSVLFRFSVQSCATSL